MWRKSVTVFRHKLWRIGWLLSQFVTECDGFRHNFVTELIHSVTKFPPNSIFADGNCDGVSVTISVTIPILWRKCPSQSPSQPFCDGHLPSQIFRHKKLWRTFVRHNLRHNLWRIRHKQICDERNCDGVLSVTISVTISTFPSQFSIFSVTNSVTIWFFFCSVTIRKDIVANRSLLGSLWMSAMDMST